jgi:hypothetical protein
VPPKTTAAIASSSKPSLAVGCPIVNRAVNKMPENAANPPHHAKVIVTTRLVFTPESLEASELLPVA